MILATDLDGTFLQGSYEDRQRLYNWIRRQEALTLVFVTGRSIESVITLLKDELIPRPHYVIADVGATVVEGRQWQPVEPIQTFIRSIWPGSHVIIDVLRNIEGLTYQSVPQRGRCSFLVKDSKLVEQVRVQLSGISCDIIYSAGKYLDVLPKGVNKGSSLRRLLPYIGASFPEVLVAGDTLNDLSLFQQGFKGIVTGNSENSLIEHTLQLPDVYHARLEGTAAILEGLAHFNITNSRTTSVDIS